MRMPRILRATLPILALAAAAHAAPTPTSEIAWRSWNAGLREAAASRRPILVDVYTTWCGWCRRMDRDVYARPDVRDYLARRFVTIKLNAESSDAASYGDHVYTLQLLATYFHVTSYPTTIFLRETGEHLVNVPGYVPADRFLLLLRYVGDGHMQRGESFEAFVRGPGDAPRGR